MPEEFGLWPAEYNQLRGSVLIWILAGVAACLIVFLGIIGWGAVWDGVVEVFDLKGHSKTLGPSSSTSISAFAPARFSPRTTMS